MVTSHLLLTSVQPLGHVKDLNRAHIPVAGKGKQLPASHDLWTSYKTFIWFSAAPLLFLDRKFFPACHTVGYNQRLQAQIKKKKGHKYDAVSEASVELELELATVEIG